MKPHLAMFMRNSTLPLRFPVLLPLACAAFAALLAPVVRAGLSEPDSVVFGSVVLNGVPVTAANHAVVIEARRSANGSVVASYEMGSDPQLGNQYALRLPIEHAAPINNPSASLSGDKLVIVVRDASGDRDNSTFTIGGRGVFTRLDFGDVDTDGDGMSDRFELQYFGSITGGNPNLDTDGDGRPNRREFLQHTNPLQVDGRHPADISTADDRLTISEVTAYTTAWLTDTAWTVEPFNIPAAYVTRAAALWKGGEQYIFTNTPPTTAPLWWVNAAKTALSSTNAQSVHASAEIDTESFSRVMDVTFKPGFPLHVEVRITPKAGTTAYAIEENPPAGWLVRNISDGGRFRSDTGRIKWGLFYDSQPRTLSYDAVPLMSASSVGHFDGLASLDGSDTKLAGAALALAEGTDMTVKISNVSTTGRKLSFDVQGIPGVEYLLEGSTNLADWSTYQTFTTDSKGRLHLTSETPEPSCFFRVRINAEVEASLGK